MNRALQSFALIGALIGVATPAFAEKDFDTQVGKFDLDPFDVLAPRTPEPPKADAAPAPKKHHHKMKHHMKKKAM